MALSIISIPGDGVTTTFTVSFALGILDRNSTTAWVTGEVDGGGNKVYRNITYLTDTLLQISGAPAGVGINVVFTRTVSQTTLVVNYEDGDIMNETNLNTAQKQALMLVHQVLDGRFSAFIQDVSAGGFKITNLGTPVNATDAANKAYVDSLIVTGQASAAAAAASAAAALVSQNAAAASAVTADNWAGRAFQWAETDFGIEVDPGLFSAKHWAITASNYVLGDISSAVHSAPLKTPGNTDEGLVLESVGGGFGLKRFTFSSLITFITGVARTFTSNLNVDGVLTQGIANALGKISMASAAIEIGIDRTVDGPALIDFHTVAPGSSDHEARIIRNTGTNGSFLFSNTGSGGYDFNMTTGGARLKTGGEAAATGQPAGTWGLTVWNATNGSGQNGLLVKNDWRAGTSTIFEVGGDTVGGAYIQYYKIDGVGNITAAGNMTALNYQKSGVSLPVQRMYDSGQQTITAGGAIILAHGLAVRPNIVTAVIQCTTAELGYGVGHELYVATGMNVADASDQANQGLSIIADPTNIVVRYGSGASTLSILRQDTGANVNITNSSWRLVIRAFAT